MAYSINPTDAHALLNEVVKEATGQYPAIQVVDTSSFVSVGQTLMASGTENVLNALSLVIGRTFMAVRPYNARLALINAIDSGMYANRLRKISFYSGEAEASGMFNTDKHIQHAHNLDNGTNDIISGTVANTGVGTMWEQKPAVPLEMNFASKDVWDDYITVYEEQLKVAFRSENDFMNFVSGIMTEKGNDIESQKEAFNRMTLLNRIAGTIAMNIGNSAVNLTAEYNAKYGTSYTSEQLRTTYLKEFLAFVVSTMKTASRRMALRSLSYHWSPTKTIGDNNYYLLRHTPRDRQRAFIYQPLITDAEASVFSAIFNPEYLDVGQYEAVDYWQNINVPSAIDVTPAVPNVASPTSAQVQGENIKVDYIVGALFDEDALMVDYQFEGAFTTPLEARKMYRNTFWHMSKGAINDFTENFIVFYMADGD